MVLIIFILIISITKKSFSRFYSSYILFSLVLKFGKQCLALNSIRH